MSQEAIAQLAKLLRTSEKVMVDLAFKMEKVSGRKNVVEDLIEENEAQVKRALESLGLDRHKVSAEQVRQVLLERVEDTDELLAEHFGVNRILSKKAYKKLIDKIKEIAGDLKGFYLRKAKAKELLLLNPPRRIMKSLGYKKVEDMLAREDVFEIFCALRFVEEGKWLNDVFFKPYMDLTWSDFEERSIQAIVLPEKWKDIGEKFLGKKLHHMSHLKELGITFVIPIAQHMPGETLYLLFMILHYIFEIDWHSRLFKVYSQDEDFARKMIDALKVQTSRMPLPVGEKEISWRVVPQYLAKHNINDPRLFEPHISTEAWHYTQVAKVIRDFGHRYPQTGLDFWSGLGVVAEFFPAAKAPRLVSFDMFDKGISLLSQAGFEPKYIYHQQEALWNHLFTLYMGEEVLDEMMMKHLTRGYFSFRIR